MYISPLIKLDDAIAVCENDSYFPEEGAHFAEALRALPVSDGVTDEMVERAARAICYDAIQMGDAHGVVMSRVNAAWKEYRQVARAALKAALGPLPAPPTIE